MIELKCSNHKIEAEETAEITKAYSKAKAFFRKSLVFHLEQFPFHDREEHEQSSKSLEEKLRETKKIIESAIVKCEPQSFCNFKPNPLKLSESRHIPMIEKQENTNVYYNKHEIEEKEASSEKKMSSELKAEEQFRYFFKRKEESDLKSFDNKVEIKDNIDTIFHNLDNPSFKKISKENALKKNEIENKMSYNRFLNKEKEEESYSFSNHFDVNSSIESTNEQFFNKNFEYKRLEEQNNIKKEKGLKKSKEKTLNNEMEEKEIYKEENEDKVILDSRQHLFESSESNSNCYFEGEVNVSSNEDSFILNETHEKDEMIEHDTKNYLTREEIEKLTAENKIFSLSYKKVEFEKESITDDLEAVVPENEQLIEEENSFELIDTPLPNYTIEITDQSYEHENNAITNQFLQKTIEKEKNKIKSLLATELLNLETNDVEEFKEINKISPRFGEKKENLTTSIEVKNLFRDIKMNSNDYLSNYEEELIEKNEEIKKLNEQAKLIKESKELNNEPFQNETEYRRNYGYEDEFSKDILSSPFSKSEKQENRADFIDISAIKKSKKEINTIEVENVFELAQNNEKLFIDSSGRNRLNQMKQKAEFSQYVENKLNSFKLERYDSPMKSERENERIDDCDYITAVYLEKLKNIRRNFRIDITVFKNSNSPINRPSSYQELRNYPLFYNEKKNFNSQKELSMKESIEIKHDNHFDESFSLINKEASNNLKENLLEIEKEKLEIDFVEKENEDEDLNVADYESHNFDENVSSNFESNSSSNSNLYSKENENYNYNYNEHEDEDYNYDENYKSEDNENSSSEFEKEIEYNYENMMEEKIYSNELSKEKYIKKENFSNMEKLEINEKEREFFEYTNINSEIERELNNKEIEIINKKKYLLNEQEKKFDKNNTNFINERLEEISLQKYELSSKKLDENIQNEYEKKIKKEINLEEEILVENSNDLQKIKEKQINEEMLFKFDEKNEDLCYKNETMRSSESDLMSESEANKEKKCQEITIEKEELQLPTDGGAKVMSVRKLNKKKVRKTKREQ